jgi:hypothetical protein
VVIRLLGAHLLGVRLGASPAVLLHEVVLEVVLAAGLGVVLEAGLGVALLLG